MKNFTKYCLILISLFHIGTQAHEGDHSEDFDFKGVHPEVLSHESDPWFYAEDDLELIPDFIGAYACKKASSSQLQTVNQGVQKRSQFYNYCISKTGSSNWCSQIERPNPASRSIFNCTYSTTQPHLLIHPSESTWKNAVTAIQLIQKLNTKGICVSLIYNWWRPEPYNANVGGAAGRHPYGTSVDVRFCSNSDAIKGFDELCKYRKQGLVRALGYYGGTGVHIGVADRTANTWGRACR